MNYSDKAKKNIYILWLLIVPFGIFLVTQFAPSKPIEWDTYFLLLFLAIIITYFPITISGTPIIFVQFINITVLLNYGILAELFIMQICFITIAHRLKMNKNGFSSIVFGSLMFFVISVVGGTIIHLLGFQVGTLDIKDVLLYGTVYAICDITLNHNILYIRDCLIGKKSKYIQKDSLWDFSGVAMTLPFGLSLYFLESNVGTVAIFLLGIPFLLIIFLVRLYSDSEKVNTDLTRASEFGHELAEQLTGKEIINMFIERISNMFPMDSAYIIDNLYGKFVVLRAIEDGENVELHFAHEDIENSLAGICYKKGIPTLFNKQSDWIQMKPPFLKLDMQSVMCVPIYRNKKIEGVLVLASRNKHSFEAYQLKIIHLLCSYFAVSLEKAKYVREAVEKSERCELTKVYNYRYLDKQLEFEMERLSLGKYQSVSLIMLDIDKFKMVNDTYGHHSGNLILQEFAKIISDEIGSSGTVTRYGGEEFVVLLPTYTKIEALNIAESLRRKIEKTPFMVQLDLGPNIQEEIIFITVSIGVSTAPEDSDEGKSLLRNADRALYIGAKQAGRNRVAEYVK